MAEKPWSVKYIITEIYYAAEHARPLKWQDAAGSHEIDLEELLYSAAEDALRLEQIERWARPDEFLSLVGDPFRRGLLASKQEVRQIISSSAGRREAPEGR